MEVGKQGEVGISFSSDMAFPNSWTAQLDKTRLLQQALAQDNLQFYMRQPNRNNDIRINPENVIMTSLDP